MKLKPMYYLLLALPVAVVSRYMGGPEMLNFVASAVSMVPLAALLGEGTEALAEKLGPRLGGLLNATLGNAAELIITLFAIKEGLLEVVKASITGSILGNILMIMGFSFLLGGLKHGRQKFDRCEAGHKATLLLLSLIALGIPSLFGHAIEEIDHQAVEYLSLGTAIVMMVIYGLWVFYTMRNGAPETPAAQPKPKPETRFEGPAKAVPHWSPRTAIGVLLGSTVLLAWMSELLVGSIEPVLQTLGWTEFFVGIVLIPIVGNIAEHLVAVQTAMQDKMDLSLEIALGSSLQIALFVAPVLVFVSLFLGHPLTLAFNPFELAALGAGALIAGMVAQDGESTWLEGAQLLAVYLILAIAFFFLPHG